MANKVADFNESKDWGARWLGKHLTNLGVESDCMCSKCLENVTVGAWPVASLVMVLCPTCGNKRCPKAEHHLYKCTGSNAQFQQRDLVEPDNLPKLSDLIGLCKDNPIDVAGGWEAADEATEPNPDNNPDKVSGLPNKSRHADDEAETKCE